jgi:hypothetical protein
MAEARLHPFHRLIIQVAVVNIFDAMDQIEVDELNAVLEEIGDIREEDASSPLPVEALEFVTALRDFRIKLDELKMRANLRHHSN